MKEVKKKLSEVGASPGEIEAFEKGASAYAKKIIANFKDFEFVGILTLCIVLLMWRHSIPANR